MKLDRQEIFAQMAKRRPDLRGISPEEYTRASKMMMEWIDEVCDYAEVQVIERDPDFAWQMAYNALDRYCRQVQFGRPGDSHRDTLWQEWQKLRKQAEKVTRARRLEA